MSKAKKPSKQPIWSVTMTDILSITDEELRRGTLRLLPPADDIPEAFWAGNAYTRIPEALYVGDRPEHAQIDFLPGFDNDGFSLQRVTLAHLRCIDADYDYRIAGIGYLLSKVIHITSILNK